MVRAEDSRHTLECTGGKPFKQRFPWIGGDLQTLRDTFVDENLFLQNGELVLIEVPSKCSGSKEKEHLIAFLNRPLNSLRPKGLILMLHGLGGSSRRRGLRRMASKLLNSGFAVLRLNLRGADPGRKFASGTYSANCNADLFPCIEKAREICNLLGNNLGSSNGPIPLFGVGLSLGGTILLNACMGFESYEGEVALDALVCISSPLDLEACSVSIERPRNSFYQAWLLKRLIQQTLEDPFGLTEFEREFLEQRNPWKLSITSSIRAFDSSITAPRWGFKNVNDYYKQSSPINSFLTNGFKSIPKTLFLHSMDDPWVPSQSIEDLLAKIKNKKITPTSDILLTSYGGHNGFHGLNGCWGDEVVRSWLIKLVA